MNYNPLYGKESILKQLEKDGSTLMMLSDEIQDHKELVLAAVQQNGYSLMYASKALKDDKEIVMEAIKQDAGAYRFASNRLKQDGEVMHAVEMQFGMECKQKEDSVIKTTKEINSE